MYIEVNISYIKTSCKLHLSSVSEPTPQWERHVFVCNDKYTRLPANLSGFSTVLIEIKLNTNITRAFHCWSISDMIVINVLLDME